MNRLLIPYMAEAVRLLERGKGRGDRGEEEGGWDVKRGKVWNIIKYLK